MNDQQQPKEGYLIPDATENVNPKPVVEDSSYKSSGKLVGKVALITGGDSGIGQAVAIMFAKEGADVAIAYYDSIEEEDAKNTVNRIKALGQKGIAFAGDIGDPDFSKELISNIVGEFGKIDIVVNNAGEQHVQNRITEISDEQLERTFKTNVFSMFYLVKDAMPYLPHGASIINTTSITAYQGNPLLIDYSSTKGAIVSFTRALSQNKEILDKKIRVNGVAPGPIWTPLIPATFPSEKLKDWGTDSPLGRVGQPVDLAPAYVYLASSDSSYVSGQIIHVNGGKVVGG